MSDSESIRLAKLLEMAGHPTSNDGEIVNALRAVRTLLSRQGRSLSDLRLADAPGSVDPAPTAEVERLRLELRQVTAEAARLRSECAGLRKAAALAESLRAELDFIREAEDAAWTHGDEADASRAPPRRLRITGEVVAVFDLLADWRSIPDLVEKLGAELSPAAVKRIVRLLDDKGLLRSVESWPTRYRQRFEGELDEVAKAFRSRIEDTRSAA